MHQGLVNTKSSINVLFRSTYKQIGLSPTILKLMDAPFYSFSGHNVQLDGRVNLLVIIDNHLAQATILNNFLIMNTSEVYNAIIKKPTLNVLRIVTSMYHLALNSQPQLRWELSMGVRWKLTTAML